MLETSGRRENLLEERRHRLPRTLVRELVVSNPRHPDFVRFRVGEAVYRAAIDDDLPVRASLGHLVGQRVDLRKRYERIVRAGANQDFCLDLPGRGRALRLKTAVK